MKAFALIVMLASLLGSVMLTLNVVTLSVSRPSGLMNPVIELHLAPDSRNELLASLLLSAISTYFFAVVTWSHREFQRVKQILAARTPEPSLIQPDDVRRLKDAIRGGDLDRVRRYATASALSFHDERFMTPLELAELYGRRDIEQAVRKATRTPARAS